MDQDESTQISRLRTLFAQDADPYRDYDREAARRWTGALFLLQTALVVGFSPLTPPTERLGDAGWAVMAGIVGLQLACAWLLLRRPKRIGDGQLLAFGYLAATAIAALNYLAQGEEAAFLPIFLLWVVVIPATHPPRRVLPFIAYVYLAATSSLLYTGWDHSEVVEMFGSLAVWLVLAAVVMLRVESFREQQRGLAQSGEEAMRLAVTDPLTGLANRRAFGEVAAREIARSSRSGNPLTLVLADLDGFKELNDRDGHMKGDEYLRLVAEALRNMLRTGDLGFRWGGDEFAMLLPDTDPDAAEPVCERVGSVVSATLDETAGVSLSLSFGIAEYREGMNVDDLVAAADADLMGGKHRVAAR